MCFDLWSFLRSCYWTDSAYCLRSQGCFVWALLSCRALVQQAQPANKAVGCWCFPPWKNTRLVEKEGFHGSFHVVSICSPVLWGASGSRIWTVSEESCFWTLIWMKMFKSSLVLEYHLCRGSIMHPRQQKCIICIVGSCGQLYVCYQWFLWRCTCEHGLWTAHVIISKSIHSKVCLLNTFKSLYILVFFNVCILKYT